MSAKRLLHAIGSFGGGAGELVRRAWVCASCRGPSVEGLKFCASCGAADFAERRRSRLAAAWASFPPCFSGVDAWPWPEPRLSSLRDIYRDTGNVLLVGPPGVGKTAGACFVLAKFLRAAESRTATPEQVEDAALSRYVCDMELGRAQAAHGLGHGELPMYRDAVRAPLLVLDELGYDLSDRRHIARDLVTARCNAGKRTIITTGHTQAAVEAAWGGGAGRRIWTESLVCEWLSMPAMAVPR